MIWPEVPLVQLSEVPIRAGVPLDATTQASVDSSRAVRYVGASDISPRGQLGPPRHYTIIHEDAEDSLLHDGDILLDGRGRSVQYRVEDGPCVLGRSLLRIRPLTRIVSPEYLALFLQTPRARTFFTRRTTFGQHSTDYGSLPVPLAPISEQQRIVERLTRIRTIRTLRSTANATLDSAEAALVQRTIDRAGDQKIARLGTLMRFDARTVSTDRYALNLPFIHALDLHTRRIDPPGTGARVSRSARLFTPRHVLLLATDHARTIEVFYPQYEGLCSVEIVPLIPSDRQISSRFLAAVLRTETFAAHLRRRVQATRTSMATLLDAIRDFPIRLPTARQMSEFDRRAGQLDSVRSYQIKSTVLLKGLFHNELRRAFSGALTANWRRAHLKQILAEQASQRQALAALRHRGQS